MAEATVTIGTDLNQLRRELAKLPNLSGDAAQKMLIKVEKAVSKAEKSAKKATQSMAKASKQASREAEKAADDAREGMKGLVELTGVSADKFDKLSKVGAALATPIGAATVAFTGLGLAVAGFVGGVTAAVLKADELAKELEPLKDMQGFGVAPDALASIEAANNAFKALSAIGKQMVVLLGAEYAPVVEKVATLMVKLGLAAMDGFQAFLDGHDIVRDLSVFLVDGFVQAIAAPISNLANLIGLMGDLASAVGADGLGAALQSANDKWDGFTKSIATTAVDSWMGLAEDGFKALDRATADYDDRAKALIGSVHLLGEAHEKSAEKAEKQTKATKGLTEATKQALKDLEGMFQAVDDGLDPVRELAREVDSVVPPEALSKLEQLQLLLINLEMEASRSAKAAAGLAEPIERVQQAILEETVAEAMARLNEETERAEEKAERLHAAFQKVGTVLQGLGDGVSKLAKGVGGVVDTLTGGALGDLGSLGGIIGLAGTPAEVDEDGNRKGSAAMAEEMVNTAVAFVEKVVESLPYVLGKLAEGLPTVLDAVIEAIPQVVQALVDALPGLFEAIASRLPELLATLAGQAVVLVTALVEQLPTLIEGLVAAIPDVITAVVDALPTLFDAIFEAIPAIIVAVLEGIPDIVEALVRAVPVIVISLVESIVTKLIPALPEIVVALITAIVQSIPAIITGLIDGIITGMPDIIIEFVKGMPKAVAELAKAGFEMARNFVRSIGQFFVDVINEIITLGKKKTKTFGDTPGPVVAPVEGLTARFSPGDVVVAARSLEGVRNQVGATEAKQGAAGPTSVRLDLTDGHLAFDRMFKRNIKSGGSLADLSIGRSSGQRRLYR